MLTDTEIHYIRSRMRELEASRANFLREYYKEYKVLYGKKYPKSFNRRWVNFSDSELKCQHTGLLNPNATFVELMDMVQVLREVYQKGMRVTSGYRHESHPIEAKKSKGGPHTKGAIDLNVAFQDAHRVLEIAMFMGFKGIGVQQKGSSTGRFIHLDMARVTPTVWSY